MVVQRVGRDLRWHAFETHAVVVAHRALELLAQDVRQGRALAGTTLEMLDVPALVVAPVQLHSNVHHFIDRRATMRQLAEALVDQAIKHSRAMAIPPVQAIPESRSVSVNLSPGTAMPILRTMPGETSTLVFLDSTSGLWPLAVTPRISNENLFSVEWLRDSPIVVVSAKIFYEQGNLTVFLKGLITLVIVNPAMMAMALRPTGCGFFVWRIPRSSTRRVRVRLPVGSSFRMMPSSGAGAGTAVDCR